MKKQTLAAAIAATKTILGGGAEAPHTVSMPRAAAELHVAPDTIIPAGTVITDEIAYLADLDEEDLARLEKAGHVVYVEVYASAVPPESADA